MLSASRFYYTFVGFPGPLSDIELSEREFSLSPSICREINRIPKSIYSIITDRDLVDVRLERITGNSCWKFHRDFVEKRLLTTYHGIATEWVKPEYADGALLQQEGFGGPIEKLASYDVAIFKGTKIESGRGIVHRSPPIEGTGRKRLLLCLNEQSDASPAL